MRMSSCIHVAANDIISFLFLFFFCLFAISWAAPAAYGGSQARDRIGAVAAGLRQSNTGSELRLRPTPQPSVRQFYIFAKHILLPQCEFFPEIP